MKAEIGAGIGIPRNAVRILKRFGYSKEHVKPVDFDGVRLSFTPPRPQLEYKYR